MAKGGKISGKTANKGSGTKFLSADKATYESNDEVLFVERVAGKGYNLGDVLEASSDGNGNLTLGYATPSGYYEQNSKTSYGVYELKTGITDAPDIHGGRVHAKAFDALDNIDSKVKPENEKGDIRSVGIDWDKVKTVSGQTYNVKDLLKEKGFKWNGAGKNWVK